MKDETQATKTPGGSIDSRRSWMTAGAAFLCYSTAIGCYTGTTGVFFTAFLEEFEADHSVTAVVSALTNSMFLGMGIPVGMFVNRYGCRTSSLVGSAIIGVAFVMTSF